MAALPSSTVKRVLLYRFDRLPAEGIVNPSAYLLNEGVELISVGGTLQIISFREIKALCFISESGKATLFSEHNYFERRPKSPGLWTRFTLRDGDELDGILPHNLLDWPESGYVITPPKAGATRQRVFLPRAALTRTELRGVVGRSAAQPVSRRPSRPEQENQLNIFDLRSDQG